MLELEVGLFVVGSYGFVENRLSLLVIDVFICNNFKLFDSLKK